MTPPNVPFTILMAFSEPNPMFVVVNIWNNPQTQVDISSLRFYTVGEYRMQVVGILKDEHGVWAKLYVPPELHDTIKTLLAHDE